MPEGFEFATWDAQIYTPLVFAPEARFAHARNADRFHMVARLQADASVEAAQRQLDALNGVLVGEYSPEDRAAALSAGFRSEVRRVSRRPHVVDSTPVAAALAGCGDRIARRDRQRDHPLPHPGDGTPSRDFLSARPRGRAFTRPAAAPDRESDRRGDRRYDRNRTGDVEPDLPRSFRSLRDSPHRQGGDQPRQSSEQACSHCARGRDDGRAATLPAACCGGLGVHWEADSEGA